ncbi:cytochrome P450 monooxygenase-like protein [Daldinia decipiens]|uniref:cytochrome P450 monooxygenase-like protein n=1 Tax=Daldinia decipiens TaxID=326647 RepID=UPI0020C2043C|nr:cytochrome P450 monooxygenase-like protein [Daldinia decipiens]KAI1654855.1 cytochrome P450 monooxygenase-like protein [Daldinia decipiens]
MFDFYLNITSLGEWLLVFFSLGSLLFLIKAFYNLFFHPLAHIPGPFWSRISSFPSWYHACRGDRHVWLWQLFQIYGDRVRSGPDVVLFCDPQSYVDIYSMKSNVRRAPFYGALQKSRHETMTVATFDIAEHARRRKSLNPVLLNEKSIRAASKFIIKHVERWVQLMIEDDEIATEWSSPVNFSKRIESLTFDIIGDLNFGVSFDIKEKEENPLKLAPFYMTQSLRFNYMMGRAPFFRFLHWMRPYGFDYLLELITPSAVQKLNQFVYNSVSDRIALQKEQAEKPETQRRQDIFYFLYEAQNPDTGRPTYDEAALRGESTQLLVAGYDTTATAICSIIFYLTGDPRRHQKLVDEILSTFESAEDIVYGPKLLECTYLRACIDEGMRLSPSLPSDLPREVLPGGLTIKGEYYPEGTIVGNVPWALTRNQEVYGDPEVFRPERWILDESTGVTQEAIAQAKSCFHPFLSGPGNCVGKNLAMASILITVARLLYHLDVRRVPGSTFGGGSPTMGWGARNENQLQLNDMFGSGREGPEVQVRKRAFIS